MGKTALEALGNWYVAKLPTLCRSVMALLMALPDQLDYLAAVDLQNRRGLDLLTLEKGEVCLFLNEECCFYVNSWGAVRDMVQQLNGRVRKSKEEIANS